jgi:uncharacterized protein YjiS (DUF1127 family)
MPVGVVIGRAPRLGRLAQRSVFGPGVPSLIASIWEVLHICSRATEAAHYYEELRSMSDAALADRGLTRKGLPREVFWKLTDDI